VKRVFEICFELPRCQHIEVVLTVDSST